jgi:hypothetical protein
MRLKEKRAKKRMMAAMTRITIERMIKAKRTP